MISFQLSEEQDVVRDAVRKFVQQELRPRARDCEASGGVPDEIRSLAREIGILLLDYPEPIGGAGLDFVTRAIVAEELAWGDPAIALYLDQPGPAGYAVMECGRLDQQIRYLYPFSEQAHRGRCAFALEEADPTSWEGNLTTEVKAGPDGKRVLNGTKTNVLGPSEADWLVVAARWDGAAGEGWEPVRFVVIPRDAEGIEIGESSYRLGLRCCEIADVTFLNVPLPDDAVLDGAADPAVAIRRVLNKIRLVNAARLVGVNRAASDHAIRYAQDRVAFGEPIGSKQGIAFKLADARTLGHAARWLVWEAAWAIDRGEDATEQASLACLQAVEAALAGTIDAVQTLGGLGFMEDAPVEKWMRDARTLANLNGMPLIQSRAAATAMSL